jgi:putative membrane protein
LTAPILVIGAFFGSGITSLRDMSLRRNGLKAVVRPPSARRKLKGRYDNRTMGAAYLWVKAFHIVFVASWFAGLFYLPRIFVNLAGVAGASHAERERLLLMATRLYRFANLLMLFALAFGVWLWWGFDTWRGFAHAWLDVKLVLVVLAIGYQHACGAILKRFVRMANRRSERWYRVFNEVAIVLFVAMVVLVVVKPL